MNYGRSSYPLPSCVFGHMRRCGGALPPIAMTQSPTAIAAHLEPCDIGKKRTMSSVRIRRTPIHTNTIHIPLQTSHGLPLSTARSQSLRHECPHFDDMRWNCRRAAAVSCLASSQHSIDENCRPETDRTAASSNDSNTRVEQHTCPPTTEHRRQCECRELLPVC